MLLSELRRSEIQKTNLPSKQEEVGHVAAAAFLKKIPANELQNYAITMTDLPKIGVNPRSEYNTPIGIYFYPASYYLKMYSLKNQLPFQHEANYIQILKFTSDQILDLNKITEADLKKLVKKLVNLSKSFNLLPMYQSDISKLYIRSDENALVNTPGGRLWYVMWKLSGILAGSANRSSSIVWNWLLRQLGYKVVIDQGQRIIHENEPSQGLIVNPVDSYVHVKTINNSERNSKIRKSLTSFGKMSTREKIEFMSKAKNKVDLIKMHPKLIQFVNDRNEQIKLALRNVWTIPALKYIPNLDEDTQINAVIMSPDAVKYFPNASDRVKEIAIGHSSDAIQYIQNPSLQLQITAVSKSPNSIRWIKNPHIKVQQAAVTRNGWTIQYIENPSEKIQLLAVKNEPECVSMIKNSQALVQVAALKKVILWNLHRVVNDIQKHGLLYPEAQMIVVKKDPPLVQFIKNPALAVQQYAVRKEPELIALIHNPDPSVVELAQKLQSTKKKKWLPPWAR